MSATLDQKKDVMFGVTPSTIEELAEIFEEVKDHVARFQEFITGASASFKHYGKKFPYRIFKFFRLRLHQRQHQHLSPNLVNARVDHLRAEIVRRANNGVRNARHFLHPVCWYVNRIIPQNE